MNPRVVLVAVLAATGWWLTQNLSPVLAAAVAGAAFVTVLVIARAAAGRGGER